MARGRKRTVETNGQPAGILDQLPSIESLESRLRELTEEAARVESLLNCVRSMSAEPTNHRYAGPVGDGD